MRKFLLIVAILLQTTISFAQQWSNWVRATCNQGIQGSAINYGYNQYGKGYEWNWKVKNTYNKTVTFDLYFKVGNDKKSWGVFTLAPGEERKHVSFYYNDASPSFLITVENVFFGTLSEPNSKRCWAECDNGSPICNVKGGQNTSNQPTTQQNDLTEYNLSKADLERQMQEENARRQQQANQTNNQRQQYINVYNQGVSLGNTGRYSEAATKYQQAIGLATNDAERQQAQNAYNKISKANTQTQALNQLSSSLMDLAKSIDAAKEAKRQKQEQERLEQEKLRQEREAEKERAAEEQNTQWKFARQYADLKSEEGYQKAIELMLPYANANRLNGMALNYIGIWYDEINDDANAMKWFKKAAEDGNGDAYSNIGIMYQNGEGVEINLIAALSYFNIACSKGIDNACKRANATRSILEQEINDSLTTKTAYKATYVAESYHTEKNYTQAEKYYFKAYEVDNSNLLASKKLGEMYFDKNKLNNNDSAIKWYGIATRLMEIKLANEQNTRLKTGLDNEYTDMLFVYGSALRKQNGKLAIETYLKAVREGFTGAYTQVGVIYELGEGGIEKDWKMAAEYYEKDAEKKAVKAMYYLGQLYEKGGPNLEDSKKQSKKWYKMACKADKKYCK